MKGWTIQDIPWCRFDRSKLNPATVRIIKAASLVEGNARHYAEYLCNVFRDDAGFCQLSRRWADEEVQHSQTLRRWAETADPDFDYRSAFSSFTEGYHIPCQVEGSIRGSCSGELLARCIVEIGTSSYYTAIKEATSEPVLQEVCRLIAADELRHYKMFYTYFRNYVKQEPLNIIERLKIAITRIKESDDDELAYAYYAANGFSCSYDRKIYNNAYAQAAYSFYRQHHIHRSMAMLFKAVGLDPHGALQQYSARLAWRLLNKRLNRLNRLSTI